MIFSPYFMRKYLFLFPLFLFSSVFAQQKILITEKILEAFDNKNYEYADGFDPIFIMDKDDELHFTYKDEAINFKELYGHTVQFFTMTDKYVRFKYDHGVQKVIYDYKETDNYGIYDETSNSYYYFRDKDFTPAILFYNKDEEIKKGVEMLKKSGYRITKDENSEYFVHSKYFVYLINDETINFVNSNKTVLKERDAILERYVAAHSQLPKLTADLQNFYSQYRVYRRNLPPATYKAWIAVTKKALQQGDVISKNSDALPLTFAQPKHSKAYKMINENGYDRVFNKFLSALSLSRNVLGM